jgi:hypothetical protein
MITEDYRSLYLSYLKFCNEHDVDGMASFYTSTIKINDVPMDPGAVALARAKLQSPAHGRKRSWRTKWREGRVDWMIATPLRRHFSST